MTRATVTPLEALKRLIAVAKLPDENWLASEADWNTFQTELAVAEMVVRDCVEPVAAQPAVPKLPSTPEEVVAFIGSNFDYSEDIGPVEDHRYTLSVHDLLSAFQAYEDAQPAVVAASVDDVLNEMQPGGALYQPPSAIDEMRIADIAQKMPMRPWGIGSRREDAIAFAWEIIKAAPAIAAPVEVERDAARLDFIEAHPEKQLRCHKKRWAFVGFTNYPYEVFGNVRDAIDAAIATGDKHG